MKKVLSFVLALCLICTLLPATVFTVSAADSAWTLVTNVADLAAGDKVVIVASSANYAMSVTQGSNNRSAVAVTKNTTNKTVSIGNSVQQFTLETGSVAGTFAFNTGSGYIYCASTSSKNYLRTQSSKDAKASWTISITSAGVATVTSKVSGISRNVLQYNSGSTLFACYSSGQQAVSIYKWIEATTEPDVPTCEHTNKVAIGEARDATCTATGITAGVKCADCGEEITAQETIAKLPHDYEETVEEATCTETGLKTETCSVCGDTVETVLPTTDHNYVDGSCSVCGAEKPSTIEESYTFSEFTAGTQYAKNEEHVLSGNVTMYTTDCHFTSELRIYSSSTNNGYAIIKSALPITVIKVNAGNKVDTLNVYGCNDGESWELVGTISVTSTSYNDYSLKLDGEYTYLKLDVNGSNQVRIKNMTLTLNTKTSAVECKHTNTEVIEPVGATCTTPGSTEGLKCSDCGDVITEPTEIPATGHNLVNGSCSVCDVVAYQLVTDVIDLQVGDKVIIVAHEYDAAMSTVDNTNYRGDAAVTKEGNTVFANADVQVVTLGAGTVNGTFAFSTGSGYLYAASSSGNYLKTGETIDNNGSWKIIIDDGVATVTAQGTNEKNQLQYNKTSTRFTCYSTNQGDICIYKLPAKVAEYTPAEGGETVSYTSWSEALKNTTGTLKMFADLTGGQLDFKGLVVDLNGKTLTANGINATVKDSEDGAGLIKVAKDGAAVLYNVESQMILWDNTDDASGYRVFNYTWNNLDGIVSVGAAKENETTTNRTFWSVLQFENQNAYKLIAAADLEVGFQVSWTPEGGAKSTTRFDFERSVITDWADDQIGSSTIYGFYIRLYGFEEIAANGTIEVTPVVKTTFTTVETETTTYEYSGN